MRVRRSNFSVALSSSVSCEVIDEVFGSPIRGAAESSSPLLLNDSTIAHFVLSSYSGNLSSVCACFVGL